MCKPDSRDIEKQKQGNQKVVTLDVGLERPADRLYCELSFRYQSAPDPVPAPDQAGRERNVGP